jgi:hypothetical protein
MKKRFFEIPHSTYSKKKVSSLRRDNEYFFYNFKVKNASNETVFINRSRIGFSLPFQNFMLHVESMKFCQNYWPLEEVAFLIFAKQQQRK